MWTFLQMLPRFFFSFHIGTKKAGNAFFALRASVRPSVRRSSSVHGDTDVNYLAEEAIIGVVRRRLTLTNPTRILQTSEAQSLLIGVTHILNHLLSSSTTFVSVIPLPWSYLYILSSEVEGNYVGFELDFLQLNCHHEHFTSLLNFVSGVRV